MDYDGDKLSYVFAAVIIFAVLLRIFVSNTTYIGAMIVLTVVAYGISVGCQLLREFENFDPQTPQQKEGK